MKIWLLAGCLLFCTLRLTAQDADTESTHAGHVPVISGGAGYVESINGGTPTLLPAIDPVLLVPLGSHVLGEARGEFVGVFNRRNGNGDYTGQVFSSLDYAQIDWLANTHVMAVGGKYILPFGLVSERLDPIWINNFQNLPLVYAIGLQTTGFGVGGQLRGVATQNDKFSVQYSAYYSAHSNAYQFTAARTTGFDTSIYFPVQHVEVGTSYQRFLDDPKHVNNTAVYLSWQPPPVPLDIKAEYDHGHYGQGYWIEAAYMLSQVPVANSFFRNVQVVGRMQQAFPDNGGGHGVPGVKTERPGIALNYYLRNNWRIISSYERNFTASKDTNLWNVGFTYRFTWPLWPGRKQ
ncbi:MAG TPA: hypothetical protein VHT28_05565 [Silvibacterium sp.]|nr:hypothetical protein [Silvibacterium sp.]